MRLNADQQRVKDLLSAFNTPIVFHPGGWADSCPEWLKLRVIAERVEMVCNGGWDKATDAEVTCYLFTASLAAPLGGDWTEITLYQAAKQMPQLRETLPATPKELSNYQMMELGGLKHKIRNRQINGQKSNRKEKGMSKRKLVLEEHDGSTLVGVLQDGCDPIIKTTEGGLDEALAAIPGFLTEAQEKWAVQPKNPAYKPPVLPKPAPKPAAATPGAPKAEELPLLAGVKPKVETPSPAPEPEAVAPEPPDKDIDAGEFAEVPSQIEPQQAETPPEGSPERTLQQLEAAVLNDVASDKAVISELHDLEAEMKALLPVYRQFLHGREGTEQLAYKFIMAGCVAQEEKAPEAEAEVTETPAAPAVEPVVAVEGEEKTAMSRMAEQAAPSQPAKPGEWEYFLANGQGPFATVQLAMDGLDLDKNNRPSHNRWDRLSTAYKEKIQRRPKL